jgi:hypothetical protein
MIQSGFQQEVGVELVQLVQLVQLVKQVQQGKEYQQEVQVAMF